MAKFSKIRRNTPIPVRLIVLVASMLIFITLTGYFGLRGIKKVSQAGQVINERYLQRIDQLSNITENLYSITIEGKNHILANDAQTALQAKKRINEHINKVDIFINEYGNQLNTQREIKLFKRFTEKYETYKRINAEIIKLSETGKTDLALELSNSNELQEFRDLQILIQSLMGRNIEMANAKSQKALDTRKGTRQGIYITILVVFIISVLISYGIITDISRSIKPLKQNLEELGKGRIPESQLEETRDELGQMGAISNRLTHKFSRLSSFVRELGRGNYQHEFSPNDEKDVLGQSLVQLRENLEKAKQEAEERNKQDEIRNWANKGLARFAEILREHSDNINELAGSIIKNTIQYVKASQGGIFILNEDNRETPHLELLAAYAFNKRKHLDKKIKIDEGLVGTCAVEKETIYITDIPDNYLEIRSGMGGIKPESLLIVPLKLQDNIFGVMEIASLEKMETYQIDFINQLADNIASTLSAARLNERTKRLLEESKQKSDELSSQEEEMRQNLEEMRATQEQSDRREIELRGILNAIDQSYIKSEYDLNGNLLAANSNYLEMVGYQFDDLKGKNVRMFVPESRAEKFESIWTNLKQGIPYTGAFSQTNKRGERKWLISSYTPVKDHENEIFKFLFLGTDISPIKQDQEEVERELEKVRGRNTQLQNDIKKNQDDFEEELKKISEDLTFIQQDKKTYEYELNEIYRIWEGHLTEAEKLHKEYLETIAQQAHYEAKLSKTEAEIKGMAQELEQAKRISLKEIKTSEQDTEAEKRYKQWLRDLRNQND